MSTDQNLSDVNLTSEQTKMPPTSYFFGETCQNIQNQHSDIGNGNKTNSHNISESDLIESNDIDFFSRRENDNLTPSIILTSDDNEWKQCEQDSISSMESISNSPSPRTSYNSLLHWGINNSKDEREYLLNKYNELPGEIMTFELPMSSLNVEASHHKNVNLGLKLAGSRDLNQMSVFVCGIQPGSIIDRDGHLEIGDQLLELNNQVLYGLSHLNAAPLIRSIYMEVIGKSSNIFRRSKYNGLRFVIQRHSSNINLMAAVATNQHADYASSLPSRHNSVDTTISVVLTPVKNTYEAKQSLELMNVAFGGTRGPLNQQTYSTTLYRGSKGFGFAIMERSAINEDGIYIKQIIEGGPADKDGILCPGDRLIRVNKKDVTHASYDTVVEWIRSSKHVLQLQVTRWAFRTQSSEEAKPSTKRFSDPSLLHRVTSILFGKHNEVKNFLSPVDIYHELINTNTFSQLSSFKGDTNRLTPSQVGLKYRRASSPNISLKKECIPPPPPQSIHNYSTAALNVQGDSVNFDKISILINDEPEIEATIRPIKPGIETEISLLINVSFGLGIGCIGGCETALNIPVIHEIYPNGAAAKDGRLRPGDRIQYVNQVSLVGVPFLEAMNKLQMAYINKSSVTKPDLKEESENTSSLTEDQNYLNLTIFRPTEQNQKWFDQELVIELLKKSGRGLGICIADRCVHLKPNESSSESENNLKLQDSSNVNTSEAQISYGVIVTEIIKGSVAATDGRLMPNDQILEVNGENTSTLSSETVGALLKAASYKVVLKVGRLRNQIVIPNSAAFLFNYPHQVKR
ncbi:hypothetical protein MN116_001611 [Schistosoma mekongi]|uniref:PDZ domain-containing protein n=1 Tax=Schistosoma mekongi TaxID=38744 RepID=A0AAE1ZJE9_SCHME|nr:hypothetical protein MN116_001611 [Schistosoma mekongi]